MELGFNLGVQRCADLALIFGSGKWTVVRFLDGKV